MALPNQEMQEDLEAVSHFNLISILKKDVSVLLSVHALENRMKIRLNPVQKKNGTIILLCRLKV